MKKIIIFVMHIYVDISEGFYNFKYIFVLSIQILDVKRELCLRVLLTKVILAEW
jgi:hypothetical protein